MAFSLGSFLSVPSSGRAKAHGATDRPQASMPMVTANPRRRQIAWKYGLMGHPPEESLSLSAHCNSFDARFEAFAEARQEEKTRRCRGGPDPSYKNCFTPSKAGFTTPDPLGCP